jgi:hypothetical protein
LGKKTAVAEKKNSCVCDILYYSKIKEWLEGQKKEICADTPVCLRVYSGCEQEPAMPPKIVLCAKNLLTPKISHSFVPGFACRVLSF